MSISVTCNCGKGYRVRDDVVGKQFVCKRCGKSLTVEVPAVTAVVRTDADRASAVSKSKLGGFIAALVVIGVVAIALARFVYCDSRSITESLMVFSLAVVVLLILFIGFAKVFLRMDFLHEFGWLLGWLFRSLGFRVMAFLSVFTLMIMLTAPVVGTLVRAVQSNSWPTVQGTVTKYQVNVWSGNRGTAKIPKVAYQYEVAGQFFTGTRIGVDWFGTDWREDGRILSLAKSVGDPIVVHYEPANPSNAVLVTGTTFPMWLALVMLMAFWCLFGYGCWASLGHRKATTTS